MEPIFIGSMLRESLAIAARNGLLILLSVAVLLLACTGNTILVTRCILSPACLPTGLFDEAVDSMADIVWIANRLATWLICGLAIRRVLVHEAARASGQPGMHPATSFHGLGRCIGYLVTLSALTYLMTPLYDRTYDLWLNHGSIVLILYWVLLLIQVVACAYAGARFAPYAAARVSGGIAEGFRESWNRVGGNRRKLLGLFFLIEGAMHLLWRFCSGSDWLGLELAPLGKMIGAQVDMPASIMENWLPQIVEYVVFVVVSDLICGAAFFVSYRALARTRPDAQASVFD